MIQKVGIDQRKRWKFLSHLHPERGCLGYLAVNKEGEALSITRINPLAFNCYVATEYSDLATFFLHLIHSSFLSSLIVRLKPDGCVAYGMWSFHHRQQLSPMLTGQRALVFHRAEGQEFRQRRQENRRKECYHSESNALQR